MEEQYKTKRMYNINKEFSHLLYEVGKMRIASDRKEEIYRAIIRLKKYIKGEIDTL